MVSREYSELPEAARERWKKTTIPIKELEANPTLAFHISWFLYREDFPEDFQLYNKPLAKSVYASKAEIAIAGTLLTKMS